MPRSIARAVVAIAVLVMCSTIARRGASAPAPTVVGMSQLDVGYRLGDGALKIRASLDTGEVLEYSTGDARDVQSILAMAQACHAGAARMSAVIEERGLTERALRAIQCSFRPGFGIARP
jgi:hypothetical protein